MEKNKREFIINDLMEPKFITHENREMVLEEFAEEGKSELKVHLSSKDNLCILNADKKGTEIHFFQTDSKKSMYKRVDHIIFGKQRNGKWKLYLIEMKSSVGEGKWVEIKGKFRAIVNDIRNCLFGLVKACIYGFYKTEKSNLLCRLL